MRDQIPVLLACAAFAAAVGLSVSRIEAQTDPSSAQALIAVTRTMGREMLAGNTAALTDVVASNFIGYDSGLWSGKPHWVPYDRAAMVKDIQATQLKLANLTMDSLDAQVYGSFGVVRGRMTFKNKDGSSYESHFLDTWERRKGTWVLVAEANFGEEKR
jgi:hypothetical protein